MRVRTLQALRSERKQEEIFQALEQKFPCIFWRTTSEEIPILQFMKNHEGHAASGGYALKNGASHEETMQEQSPGKSCSLWRGAPIERFFSGRSVAHGEPTLEPHVKACLQWEGHHTGAEEKCEKKRTAKKSCRDHNAPFLILLCHLGWSREVILLISISEATAGVLCPSQGSLEQERNGVTGEILAKDY
ncbi:hypothetical protein BTVI_132600 [Pitangus sulphuratus]|nr:hypothetical protein BTVI_132600 [Pitangus sulphuratus]